MLGPMAPILRSGLRFVAGETVRHCEEWSRLAFVVGVDDDPLVVVGIGEEFDRERAFQLSVERPRARIVTCALDEPRLSVMRAGRISDAGAATVAGLAALLGRPGP